MAIISALLGGMLFAACTPGTTNGLCCIDGTESGNCMTGNYTGYYCNAPAYSFRANKCGCPAGYVADTSDATGWNCALSACPGGYTLNTCISGQAPLFCSAGGVLQNKSTTCGCPTGFKPSGDGCVAKNCVDDPTVCSTNQTCDTGSSTCVQKSGCQYDNPKCGSGKICNRITGQCEYESSVPNGCMYGNPSCDSGYTCVDDSNGGSCVKNQAPPADNSSTDTGSGSGSAFVEYDNTKASTCCLPASGLVLLFGAVGYFEYRKRN
ncbi:MAG: hypothetical protein WC506_00835 [Candidatus Micrarchaeia archaeon]